MRKLLPAATLAILLTSLLAPLAATVAARPEARVVKLAVLAVEFADVRHEKSIAEIEQLFFGREN